MIWVVIVTRGRVFPYGCAVQNCWSAALFSPSASAGLSALVTLPVAFDPGQRLPVVLVGRCREPPFQPWFAAGSHVRNDPLRRIGSNRYLDPPQFR